MRVICHQFVPESKRQAYAYAMSQVNGDPPNTDEINVPFTSVPAGPSSQWDAYKSYGGNWWGTSSGYDSEFAGALMQAATGTEAWFIATLPDGTVLPGNNNLGPLVPETVTFWAVAEAIGLALVLPEQMFIVLTGGD